MLGLRRQISTFQRRAASVSLCVVLGVIFWAIPIPAQQLNGLRKRSGAVTRQGDTEYRVDQYLHSENATAAADYVVEKDLLVRMPDGIGLATDVYLPMKNSVAKPRKFPVILLRTPYNKAGFHRAGVFFAEHGFAVVAQDCRGRFGSEGKFYPLVNEGRDGYHTIEWAAQQPWSDGEIGTAGASYEGWVQYEAAMQDPPHLVAMFPVVAGDRFFGFATGVPDLHMSNWDLFMAMTSKEAAGMPAVRDKLSKTYRTQDSWLALPPMARAKIFRSLPRYYMIFHDAYKHPLFDEYWRQPAFYPGGYYGKFKDVPIFFISGWYDGTVGGVIRNYRELSALQKTPKRLIVGPWPHATGNSVCGDAYFGLSAKVDEESLELDWFNHWLKSKPYKLISGPPVLIFEMGGETTAAKAPAGKLDAGGRWIALQNWPPAATSLRFYLSNGRRLSQSAPNSSGSLSYLNDPAHPVPTRGGYFYNSCVKNQASLERRTDVLSFSTPILKSSISVIGKVKVRVFISSTAPDTDFIAKLVDEYPAGYSMIVGEGELRASYRKGPGQIAFITPGKIYSLTISVGPTANLFVAGHRIRLDISSTDFPRLEPNSDTAAAPGRWKTEVSSRKTVYVGGRHASYLALPEVREYIEAQSIPSGSATYHRAER